MIFVTLQPQIENLCSSPLDKQTFICFNRTMTNKVSLTAKEKKLLKFIQDHRNWRIPSYGQLLKIGVYKSKGSIYKAIKKFRENKLI